MTDPRSSCYNKKFYSTEKMAIKVMRRCMADRPETTLRYYQCSFCGFFHLTRSPLHGDMSYFLDFILGEMSALQFAVLIAGLPDAERLARLAWEREGEMVAEGEL